MTVQEAYQTDPSLLGSPFMVAIYEALTHVPGEKRVASPSFGGFSITSDGYVVSASHFLGSAEEFERNIKGLCEHFEEPELFKSLTRDISDWRSGGNAWSK
jgi:hypothetical protein